MRASRALALGMASASAVAGSSPAPAAAQGLCLCLACAFGTHRSFSQASGSMKPAVEPGDCVIARLTGDDHSSVEPGRIVIYLHPVEDEPFVKRVIAVGGQTVAMRGGRPVIDGVPVASEPRPDYRQPPGPEGPYDTLPRCPEGPPEGATCAIPRHAETLPGGATHEVLDLGPGPLDDTAEVLVPEGSVFVMGDNRDNSTDSRIPRDRGGSGLVPLSRIVGIVEEIR